MNNPLDGYTLHYSAHPGPPGPPTIGVTYSTGSSTSAASPRSLKRKRSDEDMTVAAVSVSVPDPNHPPPIILPGIHQDPDEPYVAPPSPVPTEIVEDPVEESCEDRMEAAKAAGVKVRDFAYESFAKMGRDPRAPEIWTRAREFLVLHDRYVRLHPTTRAPLRPAGKILYNLLAIGWVTKKEAEENWRDDDWKVVHEYSSRPNGPYPVRIPTSLKKPTAAYRAALRREGFHAKEDDIPEECIYVPPDEPGMDDGPKRGPLPLQRCSTTVVAPSPSPPQSMRGLPPADVQLAKRRKVSGDPTPPATPSVSPPQTLGRTLSRSASFQSVSRSGTPPADPPTPPVRNPRAIQRTRTMAIIPVR